MKFGVEKTYQNNPATARLFGVALSAIRGHRKTVYIEDTDSSDVTVRSRFDGDDEEIITGVSDAIRDYPDYEQTPLLDSIGEQLDEAQHDMFTDDDVRAATAIFEIEQRRDALLLVKHLGWTTGKALLVTKRIEALNK